MRSHASLRWVAAGLVLVCVGLCAAYRALELPHGLNGPEYDDYLALVQELAEALSESPPDDPDGRRRWERYRQIERDARAFAPIVEEDAVFAEVFDHPTRHEMEALLQTTASAERVVGRPERDVFAAFNGGWRGQWEQQGSSFVADHHWHTPQPVESEPTVFVQAVLMGEWDAAAGGRKENTIAVNAVSYRTGAIVGAVGLSEGGAARPHVGLYVDDRTLIWVALEGDDPSVYSVFWERAEDARYTIAGVTFVWDPTSGSVHDLVPKRGDYRAHGRAESAIESIPTRLPGRLDNTEPEPFPATSRP